LDRTGSRLITDIPALQEVHKKENSDMKQRTVVATIVTTELFAQERTVGFLAASVFSVAYVASPIHVLRTQWEAVLFF